MQQKEEEKGQDKRVDRTLNPSSICDSDDYEIRSTSVCPPLLLEFLEVLRMDLSEKRR